MNHCIYVIKPEAMANRAEIRGMISKSGLMIARSVVTTVPVEVLDALYVELTPDLRNATHMFMGNSECEIGEVVGENAIGRLLEICGDATNPAVCARYTIRGCFGLPEPKHVGNAVYYRNAIHRPKSVVEAERDVRLLERFLPAD